jgi:hypothetical protein
MAEVIAQRSSFIAETSYDHGTNELQVTFTDGKTFSATVPRSAYTAFITAPSRGKAWHQMLKDRFDWEET